MRSHDVAFCSSSFLLIAWRMSHWRRWDRGFGVLMAKMAQRLGKARRSSLRQIRGFGNKVVGARFRPANDHSMPLIAVRYRLQPHGRTLLSSRVANESGFEEGNWRLSHRETRSRKQVGFVLFDIFRVMLVCTGRGIAMFCDMFVIFRCLCNAVYYSRNASCLETHDSLFDSQYSISKGPDSNTSDVSRAARIPGKILPKKEAPLTIEMSIRADVEERAEHAEVGNRHTSTTEDKGWVLDDAEVGFWLCCCRGLVLLLMASSGSMMKAIILMVQPKPRLITPPVDEPATTMPIPSARFLRKYFVSVDNEGAIPTAGELRYIAQIAKLPIHEMSNSDFADN
ncbi:hypothetical protein KCU73_g32, partial [Aureobasidium melanogenum]